MTGTLASLGSGQITIDHFTTTQDLVRTSVGSTSSSLADAGVLGGERDMTLNVLASSGNQDQFNSNGLVISNLTYS